MKSVNILFLVAALIALWEAGVSALPVSSGALIPATSCIALVPGPVTFVMGVFNDDISGMDDQILTVEIVNCSETAYVFTPMAFTLNITGGSSMNQMFNGTTVDATVDVPTCNIRLLNSAMSVLNSRQIMCQEFAATGAPTTAPGTPAPTAVPTPAPPTTNGGTPPPPTPAPTPGATPAPPPSDTSTTEILAIVGLILGAIALIIGYIACCWGCRGMMGGLGGDKSSAPSKPRQITILKPDGTVTTVGNILEDDAKTTGANRAVYRQLSQNGRDDKYTV